MKTIVILGGGFGGVRVARDLARHGSKDIRLILIDKKGSHVFSPLLYEAASAAYTQTDAGFSLPLRRATAVPYREIFAGLPLEVIQAEIANVYLPSKTIQLVDGRRIVFDECIIALGSEPADFGMPSVFDYAYQFKTMDDAVAVNTKLNDLFANGAQGRTTLPIKVLVIGAGFTGIELAAEIASYAHRLSRRYRLDRQSFSVTLFEAMPQILPMIIPKERAHIVRRLTDIGVAIMTNSAIESVASDSVKLKTGQMIMGHMVVWTAGVQPNQLLRVVKGLPLTPRGKIIVEPTLQVQGLPNIYAVGDVIEFTDPATDKPVPGLAYTAIAQAQLVADNILRAMSGRSLRAYRPAVTAWFAPLGGKNAFAHIANHFKLSGIWGWLAREVVDFRYFASILSFMKAVKLFAREVFLFSKND